MPAADILVDPDEVITLDTENWLTAIQQAVRRMRNLDVMPRSKEFIQGKRLLMPDFYQHLLYEARHHHATGAAPMLAIAEKPRGGYAWEEDPIRQRVIDAVTNQVDIFGREQMILDWEAEEEE